MENKFYAMYTSHNIILVFDNQIERDEYVKDEYVVHPDIKAVDYQVIEKMIIGKEPKYDDGFGCMVIELESIGENVNWAFMHDRYDDINEFRNAVIAWNKEIGSPIADSELDRICVFAPAFIVRHKDDFFDETFVKILHSRNGENFTTIELLWKLNNFLYDNQVLKQHIYFEGLDYSGTLHLGS